MLLSLTPQMAQSILGALQAANQPFGMGNGGYTLRLGQNAVQPGSIAGWLEASFPGYVAMTVTAGWANGNDTGLGLQATMTLLPPAGGFRFTGNSGLNGTNSQTIRAVRLDFTNGTPIGTANLDPAQTITLPGDQLNIGSIQEIVTPPTPV